MVYEKCLLLISYQLTFHQVRAGTLVTDTMTMLERKLEMLRNVRVLHYSVIFTTITDTQTIIIH